VLETYVPVSAEGRLVGAVRIAESTAAKHTYLRARIQQRIATAFGMVLLAATLAWIVGSRLVARPVEQLMQQAARVGQGEFEARLNLAGESELAALSRAMNEMAGHLERSRRDLEEQNAARLAAIEQLRHADRLETVGTLASGVAHELGTPLQVISGRAEMITSGQLAASPEVVACAGEIRRQSDRVARIVRQLLDFALAGRTTARSAWTCASSRATPSRCWGPWRSGGACGSSSTNPTAQPSRPRSTGASSSRPSRIW
jgi:signal transduction histidine kinase